MRVTVTHADIGLENLVPLGGYSGKGEEMLSEMRQPAEIPSCRTSTQQDARSQRAGCGTCQDAWAAQRSAQARIYSGSPRLSPNASGNGLVNQLIH